MNATFKKKLRDLRRQVLDLEQDLEAFMEEHEAWMDEHDYEWEFTPTGQHASDEHADIEYLTSYTEQLRDAMDELLEPNVI